jgi:glycosidase
MTGTKPDERIRTPMQWSRAPHGGFTRGTPWEPAQPDSLTANVEVEERDPHSILSLHRALIHLRASNPVLADGALVPLTTSNDSVAAYARRLGDRVVLVIANLGATPARGVSLESAPGALPAGRWRLRDLLGTSAAAPLPIVSDGTVRGYVPLPVLAPLEGYVFEVSR